MVVEEDPYWGYDIRSEPDDRSGEPRFVDHFIHVDSGEHWLFTLDLRMSRRFRDQNHPGQDLHAVAKEYGLQWVHGLISLDQLPAEESAIDELRSTDWDAALYDGDFTDDDLERILLQCYRRMGRRQQTTSPILHVDVRGVAEVLRVDADRMRGIMNELLTGGLLESHAASFGHGAVDGAAQLSASGLAAAKQAETRTVAALGHRVHDVWGGARRELEAALERAGLSSHLDVIRVGLEADSPAGRQAAMYGCRSLFDATARYLWQDPRPTYSKLPGDRDDALDVTEARTLNRIGAYLNEKIEGRRERQLLRAEADRLWNSLRGLRDLASKAHDDDPSATDAAFVVAGTYLLLGEIAVRTGFEPVREYQVWSHTDSSV